MDKPKRVMIAFRLPRPFLDKLRAEVEKPGTPVKSMTALIELAVSEWFDRQEKGSQS